MNSPYKNARICFKSLSHFEFISVCCERVCSSFIYMQLSNFPSTICWRDCLFPIVYSCFLRWRLIDRRCIGLFLGSLYCSNHLHVCFYTRCKLFCLLLLCSIVWSLGKLCFLFPPTSENCFGNCGSMVPHKFLSYFTSVKKCHEGVIW